MEGRVKLGTQSVCQITAFGFLVLTDDKSIKAAAKHVMANYSTFR